MLYWGIETLSIEDQGVSLNTILPRDYGVPDYPEVVLVTTEEKLSEDPEVVKKFVRAVARGYKDASADLVLAVQAMKRAHPEVDADFQKRSAEILSQLWKADNGRFGWQEESRWLTFAEWMKDNNLLPEDIDARQAFTNSFVESLR